MKLDGNKAEMDLCWVEKYFDFAVANLYNDYVIPAPSKGFTIDKSLEVAILYSWSQTK